MSSPTRPALALRCHGGLTSQQCVEQAVAAEHAGFSTVWFAENPFGRGAWPGAAACAVALVLAVVLLTLATITKSAQARPWIASAAVVIYVLSAGIALLGD